MYQIYVDLSELCWPGETGWSIFVTLDICVVKKCPDDTCPWENGAHFDPMIVDYIVDHFGLIWFNLFDISQNRRVHLARLNIGPLGPVNSWPIPIYKISGPGAWLA